MQFWCACSDQPAPGSCLSAPQTGGGIGFTDRYRNILLKNIVCLRNHSAVKSHRDTRKISLYQPERENDVLVSPLIVIIPVQPSFVELDNSLELVLGIKRCRHTWYDHLGYLQIGLLGGHKVRLLRTLPLDQEEQISRLIGGAYDLVRLQASSKPAGLSLLRLLWAWNNFSYISSNTVWNL